MSRVVGNVVNLRSRIHRARLRPDPYGLPGWIVNSDQLANRLSKDFGAQFNGFISEAFHVNAENGCFICYDQANDKLKLGPLVWGQENMVLIQDCIGYRAIGSFHTHVHTDKYRLAFSPPDIQSGLGEFALAVGGSFSSEQREKTLAVLSPYNYWKLPREEQDEIDYLLNQSMLLIYQANAVVAKKPEGWVKEVEELEMESKLSMREVFRILNMVYVPL